MSELYVLDPTSGPDPMLVEMAPRVDTLDGKVIGLVDIGKHNSGNILDQIANSLSEKYKIAGLVKMRKDNPGRPSPSQTLDELAEQVQVAIVGVGD